MRIAVAGTHGVGKSTLIRAFAAARPEYAVEAEPYEELAGSDEFVGDISAEAFERQLEYHAQRAAALADTPSIVFERCAADLLAYIVVAGADESASAIDPKLLELARRSLATLDLIVFLPLRRNVFVEDEEEPYRRRVDRVLGRILLRDELNLFDTPDAPAVIELGGATAKKLQVLLNVVDQRSRGNRLAL